MAQGFSTQKANIAGNGITQIFINGVLQNSTSGTDILFSGIPAGIKRFTLTFNEVEKSSSGNITIELGDAGGLEVTGYESGAMFIHDGAGTTANTNSSTSTTYAHLAPGLTGYLYTGVYEFVLHDASTNHWVGSWTGHDSANSTNYMGSTSKALSGELTQVNVTPTTGTFSGGSINIQYDNPNPTVMADCQMGKVIQAVFSLETDQLTGTTAIPFDGTTPQNTEGDEMLSASITPTNVGNKLKIEVVVNVDHSATNVYLGAALFQDSTADAIAGGFHRSGAQANSAVNITFTHWMDAGTTDSTTFAVRVGGSTGSTTYLNSVGSTHAWSGALTSSITVTEYKA